MIQGEPDPEFCIIGDQHELIVQLDLEVARFRDQYDLKVRQYGARRVRLDLEGSIIWRSTLSIGKHGLKLILI
jgi:hypothetical protein